MRNILIIALAFIAGLFLMYWVNRQPAPAPATVAAAHVETVTPPPAGSMAKKAMPSALMVATAAATDQWPVDAPTPEQVMYAQTSMVRKALTKLTPRVSGKPNLYLVTFAGDGQEDVFRNEAEYAARLFAQRFGASAHSVVLENNPATLADHPLADWSNLEQTLAGLAKVMHPDQDILMLYLTSHGSEDHYLLVDMDPLPLDQIGSKDLARILARHHFKWKVIVVNACYSGGFVPPLQGTGTLVITAARRDRSSFGCGSDSNLTYFGRAFLVDGLNRTDSFADAFEQARAEVARWEKRDKFTPSEPQIDIGKRIARQLALWRQGFKPGPAAPFNPPMPKSKTSPASASTAATH